jgi:hypothetical protein
MYGERGKPDFRIFDRIDIFLAILSSPSDFGIRPAFRVTGRFFRIMRANPDLVLALASVCRQGSSVCARTFPTGEIHGVLELRNRVSRKFASIHPCTTDPKEAQP